MTAQHAGRVELFCPTDLLKPAFNRAPLLLEHTLNEHPLLSMKAVRLLAQRLASQPNVRGFFVLPEGEPIPGDWGSLAFQRAVAAGFDGIETNGMRLKLSSIHLEPDYRDFADECAAQLDSLTGGELLRNFPNVVATLFIASPGEITPYHVDSEPNFLFQISGTKSMYIYDGSDSSVITNRDLERYWGARQIDMPTNAAGQDFALKPGLGVHNPVHFPHWVKNGPDPSISLSLGFGSSLDLSYIFRVNYRLRRLGISPAAPGSNPRLDNAKSSALKSIRNLKHLLTGRKAPLVKID